ncbi:Mitochondrial inner membrane protease ATP23 like protein [Habropoda laboriosa]|uniref:Mitochondrial inner membrane protease ATP23 n=1 Tax=Habropoda laboriosa TaxID=597456 RepID=A0A0L7R2C0_9HYME|nr:PREDICTED: mitochondrial inner membrane protease ATP23 homolog [Habropoda laboriosa]KOC64978.1 Mitochondrial inner membrane protease ATP23 like protein [Habropoda laboriosa]
MTVNSEENKEQSVQQKCDNTNVGYSDLYPGRKQAPIRSWWSKLFLEEKLEQIQKTKCELNVYDCIKESPAVKLMMAALKSSGCEIDIGRHISCEVCDKAVTGGYDPQLNQIIICQNTAADKGRVQSSLVHEMIHMFDYCRYNLNLKNVDHLACTEIRAANLCHCSFLGAVTGGTASPFKIKQMHRNCVADKATRSIMAVQDVTKEEAIKSVTRVFHKCYNDLEPIGRRIRRNSEDMKKAYLEASLYGYID